MRWWVGMLWGCGPPGPGELGYIDCAPVPMPVYGGLTCSSAQACCEVIGDQGSQQCWYETETGRRFQCRGEDCYQAAFDLICATCVELQDGMAAEAAGCLEGA